MFPRRGHTTPTFVILAGVRQLASQNTIFRNLDQRPRLRLLLSSLHSLLQCLHHLILVVADGQYLPCLALYVVLLSGYLRHYPFLFVNVLPMLFDLFVAVDDEVVPEVEVAALFVVSLPLSWWAACCLLLLFCPSESGWGR